MTTKTTRRAVLAGAAALPALAILPAAALCSPAADPIIAAIERHRQAEAAFVGAYDNEAYRNSKHSTPATDALEERAGEFLETSNKLYVDLVTMTPTTLAGCAALLRHIEDHERSCGVDALLANHPKAKLAARDLLSRIAKLIDAGIKNPFAVAGKAVQS
jgi:hypothetical protein